MDPSRHLWRSAVVAMSVLTLAGCASTRVNSFVERGVDFSRYHTYKWVPISQFATGDPRLDNNRFFMERVQADVEQQLAMRGFEKTTSETPDLLLHYHASISQRLDVPAPDPIDGHCTDCTPSVYEAGTLVIDVVDARAEKLIWRGWSEGSMDGVIDNQEWLEARIDDAVTRILGKLPRRL